MNKRLTGVKFSPQEFRLLRQCLRCGKAGAMVGDVCQVCLDANIPNCKMCEILLRSGTHKFYTYDIKEDHRGGEDGFKASKEMVREFEYEVSYDNSVNSDGLCNDCLIWTRRDIKNRCGICGKHFLNSREHYKDNGNICQVCSDKSNVESIIHEREKGRDSEVGGRERVCEGGDEDKGVQGDVSEWPDRDFPYSASRRKGNVQGEDIEGQDESELW